MNTDKVDVVITHFNDEKVYFYDVVVDSSHPHMFGILFNEGYNRCFNYRVIKELFIKAAQVV